MMQEFVQQLEDAMTEKVNGIHTAIPGTITDYDAGSGMAEVKPEGTMKMPDGKKLHYPSVSGVPVVFPQGAGQKAVIAFPVKAGDGCLLILCENDIQSWLSGTEEDNGGNRMKFDLTNGICIPGLFHTGSDAAQQAAEDEAIVINMGKSTIVMQEDSTKLSCSGKEITITQSGIKIEGNVVVHGTITES